MIWSMWWVGICRMAILSCKFVRRSLILRWMQWEMRMQILCPRLLGTLYFQRGFQVILDISLCSVFSSIYLTVTLANCFIVKNPALKARGTSQRSESVSFVNHFGWEVWISVLSIQCIMRVWYITFVVQLRGIANAGILVLWYIRDREEDGGRRRGWHWLLTP